MAEKRTPGMVVGRVLGAPVIVQPSTLLMIVVFAFLFTSAVGEVTAQTIAVGAVLALSLTASVFLHELAHALAARAFRRKVTEIVLTLWGGHTSFESRQLSPMVNGVTAVAGPAMNLLIAALTGTIGLTFADGLAAQMLLSVTWANVVLAGFNVLPGLPMDGGRVVESVVWALTKSRDRGTWVAAWGGRVVAVGVVVVAVAVPVSRGQRPDVMDAVISFLVAGLLWSGASAALRFSSAMIKRDAVSVATLMTSAVPVPYTASVAVARAAALDSGVLAVVVIGADAAPAGYFPVERTEDVPEDARESASLQSVTSPIPRGAVIAMEAKADVLIPELRHWWGRADAWVVLDGESIVGVLRLGDVVAALE